MHEQKTSFSSVVRVGGVVAAGGLALVLAVGLSAFLTTFQVGAPSSARIPEQRIVLSAAERTDVAARVGIVVSACQRQALDIDAAAPTRYALRVDVSATSAQVSPQRGAASPTVLPCVQRGVLGLPARRFIQVPLRVHTTCAKGTCQARVVTGVNPR